MFTLTYKYSIPLCASHLAIPKGFLLTPLLLICVSGLEIEASSDVVVYAVNKGNGSSDAFLALPRDALGDEYYVASYKPSKTYLSQVSQ